MRRVTAHVEQLRRAYSVRDGRLRGPEPWEKLPYFWFHLFLSYRCTKSCSYCYSFNQVGRESLEEMDERTFLRLLEWIPEVWKANNVKVNAIGFLGGEPLLRTDRIRAVMDAVYSRTEGMQGFVYTNGDPVDSVKWDDLEDIQWISTNVTDVAIEEVSRRMGIVCERSNVINQTVVATLDDFNMARILDVTRFGIESGFRLRYCRDLYGGLDEAYRRRLLGKYHEIVDLLEGYAVRGFDVHTTFLLDTLIPGWTDEESPYLCGKRAVAVYPDGSIGPCLRNHTAKTGTVWDDDPMPAIRCERFHYELASPGLPDECRECEARTTCQGGCPHDKMLLRGSNRGPSVVCDIHREIVPRLRNLERLKKGRRGD